MQSYFITDGERGPLKFTGQTSAHVRVGQSSRGYTHLGKPGDNYTTKKNDFCVWSTTNLRWEMNPHESEARAAAYAEETERLWSVAREARNRLLLDSDWTQLPDVPIETKTLWAAYRQALRDVTSQPDPRRIVWPAKPV